VPGGRQRTGFRLAIAHHDCDDEIRIIERRSVCVRDGVPELAAFVNQTRRLRGAVRADSSGKGKLLEEFKHSGFVAAE
jgi:hypothetical protein